VGHLLSPLCLDYSRICWKANQGIPFHTEATEAKHGEHREVSEIRSVHSVADDLESAREYRLRELCVNRFYVIPLLSLS